MPKTPKPLKGKKLAAAIEASYYKHFDRVEVMITDLGKIRRAAETAYATTPTLEAIDASMAESLPKYRRN